MQTDRADARQRQDSHEGGLWVDAYNQCVSTIAGTIRARVDGCNMFYVTEMKRRFTPPPKAGTQGNALNR